MDIRQDSENMYTDNFYLLLVLTGCFRSHEVATRKLYGTQSRSLMQVLSLSGGQRAGECWVRRALFPSKTQKACSNKYQKEGRVVSCLKTIIPQTFKVILGGWVPAGGRDTRTHTRMQGDTSGWDSAVGVYRVAVVRMIRNIRSRQTGKDPRRRPLGSLWEGRSPNNGEWMMCAVE